MQHTLKMFQHAKYEELLLYQYNEGGVVILIVNILINTRNVNRNIRKRTVS